jgi:hypothetical protein
MVHNPNIHLALARARQEEILREARRHRLRYASGNERPSALGRLAALLRRRRPAQPAATASS